MPNPLLIYGYKPRWVAELYRIENLEKDNLAPKIIPCQNRPMNSNQLDPLKTIKNATSAENGSTLKSAFSLKSTKSGTSIPTASADICSRDRLYSA